MGQLVNSDMPKMMVKMVSLMYVPNFSTTAHGSSLIIQSLYKFI